MDYCYYYNAAMITGISIRCFRLIMTKPEYLYRFILMNRIVLLIVLIYCGGVCEAQRFFTEHGSSCTYVVPCLYCGNVVCKSGDLTQYFKSKIAHVGYHYETKSGKIIYEVYVDSNGRSCAFSVKDERHVWQMKEDIEKWISELKWSPAVWRKKKINSTILLEFDFLGTELSVRKVQPKEIGRDDKRGNPDSLHFDTPPPFTLVDIMPKPGYDLQKYLADNMHYPEAPRLAGIEGRVILGFAINEEGKAIDIVVRHGISSECDEEAIRMLTQMPAWSPGLQNGKPVKVYFTLPLTFKLTDPDPESTKD